MALDNYFDKVRREYPAMDADLGRVLLKAQCTCPERTLTLSQIRDGYKELTEEKFPSMGDPWVQVCFMLSMPYVAGFSNKHGTFQFYILQDMMQ